MNYSLKRTCLQQLHRTFGLEEYRPGQKAAVHALLSGWDVMCILPTGAGKSLCWQLPAVVHEGLTVVVSPLIALMRDQVQHLADVGIPAVTLDSLMSEHDKHAAIHSIRQGSVRIVFVSPERLEDSRFRCLCSEVKPWLMVVDEAHCVVQWGESFRPAYANIGSFLQSLPKRPVLCALTATADDDMQRAIEKSLAMRRVKRILLPIVRENFIYDVRTTLDRTGDILRMVQQTDCKTVIFCRSRSRTEYLSALLNASGVEAEYYHAGRERTERLGVQRRFAEGNVQILCATTAFGLGIDIPDIRRVMHDYLPDSLVDYVQQTGRAGRDFADAHCILLLEPNDLVDKVHIRERAKALFRWQPIRRWYYLHSFWKHQNQLLRVLLQKKCIMSGIAAALGHSMTACGRCSACRRGRLVRGVPSLAGKSEWQVRAWLFTWQRQAMADKLGVPPSRIISDRAIHVAAKRFVFPAETQVRPELLRLLVHFRRENMHTTGHNRI